MNKSPKTCDDHVVVDDIERYNCTCLTVDLSDFDDFNLVIYVLAEPGLDVTEPTVKVLKPSAKECQNKKDQTRKTLVCVASGFYPDHVSLFWKIDGEDVTEGVATDNAALRDTGHYRITSRLRVSAKSWYTPGERFSCFVSFFNGSETIYRDASVLGVQGMFL